MQITRISRYPVKSMGGESLATVLLDDRGLVGDRWWAVEDGAGRFASGKSTRRFRRRDPVFTFTAGTQADTVHVTRGAQRWTVEEPALAEVLSAEMGVPVRLTPERGVPHHDDGAVSLVGTASLAWCAERFGGEPDPRRLRVNLVVETTEPFVEETWRTVRIGTSVLSAVGPVPRCRMVDIEQDGQSPGAGWLQPLSREREMCLAVYLDVATAGRISLGDRVEEPDVSPR